MAPANAKGTRSAIRRRSSGREAAEILERRSGEIGDRWLERLRGTVFASRADLTDADLRDDAPRLIAGLARALRGGAAGDPQADWTAASREHAALRHRQNVPIASLILEYQTLCLEMLASLERAGAARSAPAAFGLARDLAVAVDTMTAIAAEAYVDVAREETGRLAAELNDLASTVAHDLRQPLTAILTQSEVISLLLQQGQVEPARRSARIIAEGVRRMNAMIQDLVDGVRLEAGKLPLERRPVDLAGELEAALRRTLPEHDAARLRLTVEGSVPPVWADPARLERLVLNLVTNALKYSDPAEPVEVRVRRSGGEAEIEVRDRGVGIAPEDLPHVFEQFYRGRSAGRDGGIGLGLYISRILAEAHGGRVRVESEPGRGSAFFVTLPLVADSV